ncbi:hypothetical protein [Hamadaea tsunoensis]|uniref:hypothetical protein n=1 Tax=Hamadaea tsunoensis TaxID=53368 RepID=UPI0003FF6B70|nr:hypothetical protein [Hamadaea tsunoensis]
MPEPTPGPWYDVRRSIALAGLALWFFLAGVPLAALIIWWSRGQLAHSTPSHVLFVLLVPAAVNTASAAYAIGVLQTRDPRRARRFTRWQLLLLCAGLATFLVATALHA